MKGYTDTFFWVGEDVALIKLGLCFWKLPSAIIGYDSDFTGLL